MKSGTSFIGVGSSWKLVQTAFSHGSFHERFSKIGLPLLVLSAREFFGLSNRTLFGLI